jgi:hypothetical protein
MVDDNKKWAKEQLSAFEDYSNTIAREDLPLGEVAKRFFEYFVRHPEGDLLVNLPVDMKLKDSEVNELIFILSNPYDYGIVTPQKRPIIEVQQEGPFYDKGSQFFAAKVKLSDWVTEEYIETFLQRYVHS